VTGGFVLVKLNEPVTKGQKASIQRNACGDVAHEHTAGVDGCVAIIGTEAIHERGMDIRAPTGRGCDGARRQRAQPPPACCERGALTIGPRSPTRCA